MIKKLPRLQLSRRHSDYPQSSPFQQFQTIMNAPMTTPTDKRSVANDQRLFIEELGYEVVEDLKQAGQWIWTAPSDQSDRSFATDKAALDAAWTDAVSWTMGASNLSSETWDAMSFEQQKASITEAMSDEGPPADGE